MTNMMISSLTLSTFHSCQATYQQAHHMVFTFRSLSDMQDATYIMMTFVGIVINFQSQSKCFTAKLKIAIAFRIFIVQIPFKYAHFEHLNKLSRF